MGLIWIGLILIAIVMTSNFIKNQKELKESVLSGEEFMKKYPQIFAGFIESDFRIIKVKNEEVEMQMIIEEQNLFINCNLIYQSNKRLQLIIQFNYIKPRKYISTKSFFYSSDMPEEEIGSRMIYDMAKYRNSLNLIKSN